MPDIGGLEAIRRVRAHANPAVAGVPIVVLSALVTKDDIQASLGAGADAFLGKPYRPERLEAIIGAVSGRARRDPSGARDALQPEPNAAPEQASREVDASVLASRTRTWGCCSTSSRAPCPPRSPRSTRRGVRWRRSRRMWRMWTARVFDADQKRRIGARIQ